ncbi:FadR/GntR family transcriptional regulator [Neptunomonas marina]|uniref:Pyruvate dehydrogenase complex repressor n=1 Tax=Neptunomonas marina TaxID=1815562 RepID=A0A437QCF4_9GAMM|nr:FCD domain-containing protein [Neptunomonas marina]RVU32224.1 FadR family transcriptional regulator [Neptunomonas marina]
MSNESQKKRALYHDLIKALAQGELIPGERLPSQRQLAEQRQLSRSTVREVVQQLELEGMIATKPGGRSECLNLLASRVELPVGQIDSLPWQIAVLEARAFIEGEAAYFCALRATDQQMTAIENEYQRMQRRGRGASTLEKAKADLKFHMLVAESSHHLLITAFSQLFYSRYFNAIYGVLDHTLKRYGRYPDGIAAQHFQIYQALMQRDADKAKRIATEHIHYTRRLLETAE